MFVWVVFGVCTCVDVLVMGGGGLIGATSALAGSKVGCQLVFGLSALLNHNINILFINVACFHWSQIVNNCRNV